MPDEFLQDGSNKRTDTYGGSVENRSRFLLEVVEAMVSVWGGNRVAARIGLLPVRDYLGSVLPGLADFPINRVAELTPTAWAARI